MKGHCAFLGLLLALLMGQSSTLVYRNPDCYQLTDYGTCQGYHIRWAYSIHDRRCVMFTYSSCGGNSNRFSTKEDCEMACS